MPEMTPSEEAQPPPTTATPPRVGRAAVIVYRTLGWAALALATAGVVLPLLPTTPFLLVSAWAFARSSPELAARLRHHPRFGPLLRAWQDHGAIPRRAKAAALTLMALSWILLAFIANHWIAGGVGLVLACVAVFIVTRPNG